MAIKCNLVSKDKYPKEIGDMWFDHEWLEPHLRTELSNEYITDWFGKRDPIIVILPDNTRFVVDQRSTNARENDTHTGWKVVGEAPNLSITPSIKISYTRPDTNQEVETYHGFLTNGELSK